MACPGPDSSRAAPGLRVPVPRFLLSGQGQLSRQPGVPGHRCARRHAGGKSSKGPGARLREEDSSHCQSSCSQPRRSSQPPERCPPPLERRPLSPCLPAHTWWRVPVSLDDSGVMLACFPGPRRAEGWPSWVHSTRVVSFVHTPLLEGQRAGGIHAAGQPSPTLPGAE